MRNTSNFCDTEESFPPGSHSALALQIKCVDYTRYLPSCNPLQDQTDNTDLKGLPETWQSVKELKYFPQKIAEIYCAW